MKAEGSMRPDFASARQPLPSGGSASHAEAVRQKAMRVTEYAVSHFEKQRNTWAARRFSELLARDAPGPSLRPKGHGEDRTSRLMRAANFLTESKQLARLERIKSASGRMASGRSAHDRDR